jgi:hypothetical protein
MEDNFPIPFQSNKISDGSRTIDNTQSFKINVSADGFEVIRESGPWSVSDLFGEMDYWPKEVIWSSGLVATLDEVLAHLSKQTGLNRQALLRPILAELDETQDLDIVGYLADEMKAVKGNENLSGLRKRWSALEGNYRVPGIPSPEILPKHSCYNGLELYFDAQGWSAKLYSDAGDLPELFNDLVWSADTFNGLFRTTDAYGTSVSEYLPWPRDELIALLIKDDPRWGKFVGSE